MAQRDHHLTAESRDLLGSALDTYLSIISNDVSQTVKKMTAVTAILMVTALIAGIYGMNFDYMPELHWPLGYPYAVVLMLGAALVLWLLFRLHAESGAAKLLSGDATWRNLTAMVNYYETAPLPTWVGWYVHQMPVWAHFPI